MPAWVDHAIWWQVYPLGFLGAEAHALPDGAAAEHRLPALEGWLDHLVSLGASGLLLGPVFASSSHGYDTTDHLRVDARLGGTDDLVHLIEAAHARGVRVMLDGVFNHVGREHPRFAAALAAGPGSPEAQWFHLFPGREGGEPEYEHFEGHRALPVLRHDEPAVADLVVEVMCRWLDAGADAWRLDAAYAVPASFWARVLPRVRERHPDVYVVGEVIHGDYAGYVAESGVDAVTQYELWKAVWSSLNDVNFHELAWCLARHDELLDGFVPMTFVGNHDVTRILSRLDDPRHLAHALVVLMTVAGTPSLYAGDELGMRGVKEDREGGDDAVRPAFPAQPPPLGGAEQAVLDLHRRLIALRRRHPWLHTARTSAEHVANDALVYASTVDGGRVVVALSAADEPAVLPAPGATAVLEGDAGLREGPAGPEVELPPHGWAVLAG